MRYRTEDLLTLRDGEPIDVEFEARLANDAEAAAAIERLRDLADEIGALPALAPPDAAEARVLAAMRDARGGGRSQRAYSRAASVAGIAAAAAVTVAIAAAAFRLGGPADPSQTAHNGAGGSEAETPYVTLVAESARLEQMLSQLPAPRRVVSGGTAGTIAGLEDQIAFIDDQLTIGAVGGLEPGSRHALWQERVDVMNALVQVRYAQSQAFWY
jgi:hypothetical protein